MPEFKASRWWLAPVAVLALAACDGGGDQAAEPDPPATSVATTIAGTTTNGAPTVTADPTTVDPRGTGGRPPCPGAGSSTSSATPTS